MTTHPISLPEKFQGQREAWWATVQRELEAHMTEQLSVHAAI